MAIECFDTDADAADPQQWSFAVMFVRNRVKERHEFTAAPSLKWQDMKGLFAIQAGAERKAGADTATVITQIDRMIRRALIDDDGTPVKWSPAVKDGEFTDPSGDLAPASMAAEYEAFEQGSSRRRWAALMDDDDDVSVEADQIMRLFQRLCEVAGGRPTERSAPSPG